MNLDIIKDKTVILKSSLGKDATLSLDILHEHGFNIICIYNAWIPNLPSDMRYIKYMTELYPNTKWCLSTHPTFASMLCNNEFQDFNRMSYWSEISEKYEKMIFNMDTKKDWLKDIVGDLWTAIGVKKHDSLRRRCNIAKTDNGFDHDRKIFYPVSEYTNNQVFSELRDRDIKLHPHYQLFGRSFDGLDGKYLTPLLDAARESLDVNIRAMAKQDFEYIESIFPFIRAKCIQQKLLQKRIVNGKT